MLVQQNVDGSNFFNRSWEEFKVGFNNSKGNYWLGNELLHQLTDQNTYKLRIDLKARNQSWYYAEYRTFLVYSEAFNYKIVLDGFSGNTGAAGNAFNYQNNMMFTTYDRDNDLFNGSVYKNNCAVYKGGGFWYRDCAWASLNGHRAESRFYWGRSGIGFSLELSRMWLTC